MARIQTYGYYAISSNKYGRGRIDLGEGPWYGGIRGGDPAITIWSKYGINFPPPVPANFTIEYYPTTSDSMPLYEWTATALEDEGLQYQIQVKWESSDFTSPDFDFGPFDANAMTVATWWSYETPAADVLVLEGTYYARIRSTDGFSHSAWSSTLQFEFIKTSPPIPTIDDVTSPTDSFVQLISGNKVQDAYVFIRNNGGPWYQASYTYGIGGTEWYYSLTLSAGTNSIEVIASWTTSTTTGISGTARATIYTIFEEPEVYNVWNCFDELGMLVSLDRIAGERNKSFKHRILDVFINPGNSTYQGLINAIARELNISPASVTVSRLSDLADSDYSSNILNSDGNAIDTKLEDYAEEVYRHNPIFWGTVVADESVWDCVDEEYSGMSYLPHLWDPTASGIYEKWQKTGIGDQDDLWVNDIVGTPLASGMYPDGSTGAGMMTASGVQRVDLVWRAPVHSGYFYVNPSGTVQY
jgi:hypothetical protein